MKHYLRLKNTALLLLISCIAIPQALAQTTDDDPANIDLVKVKGFRVGFYVGSFFSNNYTASVYDGYGFDVHGDKNTFISSYLNRKIFYEYGGYNGQHDYIADELTILTNEDGQPAVNHGEWHFYESDMPNNLKYKPVIIFGLHTSYGLSKKDAILFNLNFAELKLNGTFTITLDKPPGTDQYYKTYYTFHIGGEEQRMLFQLGYSRIFGNHEKVNFFGEAGLSLTYAKLMKNSAQIGALALDLTTFTDPNLYPGYQPQNLVGTGFGAFAGLGLNLRMNEKYTAQLLYTPSYETVNIGLNPTGKMQNAIGLRVFYSL